LYFWSLIVAVLIFGLGGGVCVLTKACNTSDHPEPMHEPFWNYIVLGVAGAFETASFVIALRQFLEQAGDTPFWEALHRSKDPTTYTVLAEDSAAPRRTCGCRHRYRVESSLRHALTRWCRLARHRAAARGRRCSAHPGIARPADREKAYAPRLRAAIRSIALGAAQGARRGTHTVDVIGPDDVLVTMDLDFDDGTAAVDASRQRSPRSSWQVRERYPMIKRLFIEAGAVPAKLRWSRPDSTQAPAAPPRHSRSSSASSTGT
jgi:hypothetical protein